MAYAQSAALIATPIGPVRIETDGHVLTAIRIGGAGPGENETDPLLREAVAQLSAYFEKRLTEFTLPLAPSATPRGGALREAIVAVRYGDTASYGAIARLAASSPRAVGQACARNPFPILVPCHRVLQSGGRLGPYSAGEGPATKRHLLMHEHPETQLL